MSFWSDSSPIVKISVVVGVVGLVGLGAWQLMGGGDPYEGETVSNQRGLSE